MNDDPLREQFDRKGFVIVPKLLNDLEVSYYKERLEALSGFHWSVPSQEITGVRARTTLEDSWKLPDGVTRTADFWPLIEHDQLLYWVRKLLGPEIRYLQHSDLHVGRSSVSWHRDSVNRRFGQGSEWDLDSEKYQLVRCAVYLQTFEDSGFQLGLIPGSHLPENPISLRRRWKELSVKLLNRASRISPTLQGLGVDAIWVKTEPGDAVIFDPRILHAGSYINGPKYSMFVGFGIENGHYWKHQNYYRYMREDLGYLDPPADLVARLKDANLYPKHPRAISHIDHAWKPIQKGQAKT